MPNKEKLLNFVKLWHGDQERKYTGDPYYTHLVRVAELAEPHTYLGYEVGILHDIKEDTLISDNELMMFLLEIYPKAEAFDIFQAVCDLTDVYTSKRFPHLNRKDRKFLETIRLSKASSIAQTVKYADIIDNSDDIYKHDEKFAKVFFSECHLKLCVMTEGELTLREKAMQAIKGQ